MISLREYINKPNLLLLAVLKRSWFLFTEKRYLKIRYYLEEGKRLNIKEPKTFTEKIQWLKLNNRQDIYTTMVDKITVKQYVASLINDRIIIPTIGVWNRFDDIDFGLLPDSFVLKTNHSGGGTGVVICRDKSNFDIISAKRKINASLKDSIYNSTKEWPYKNVVPKVFAEQLLITQNGEELTDYKFYCFDGIPKYCQVIRDRRNGETIDFFDMNWIHQPFYGLNPKCKQSQNNIEKPKSYEEMIHIAKVLSKDIPFVRVDLYDIHGKIYFGEITFFPASGYGHFTPEEYDLILGNHIKLPKEM